MISAYVPTKNSKEEDKIKFYDQLEKICESVKRNNILMIVGHFNAKIGKEGRNAMRMWQERRLSRTPLTTERDSASLHQ
jgi:exonuclease III